MASSSDETIDVENPATEQLVASVPSATAADVDVAVTAARAALPRWAQTTVAVIPASTRSRSPGPGAPVVGSRWARPHLLAWRVHIADIALPS